jgi:hypothetical protein
LPLTLPLFSSTAFRFTLGLHCHYHSFHAAIARFSAADIFFAIFRLLDFFAADFLRLSRRHAIFTPMPRHGFHCHFRFFAATFFDISLAAVTPLAPPIIFSPSITFIILAIDIAIFIISFLRLSPSISLILMPRFHFTLRCRCATIMHTLRFVSPLPRRRRHFSSLICR